MTNRQIRRYEMLVRVGEFGAARRAQFPESSLAGQLFATVADAVTQLRDRAVTRLALKQERTRARAAARAAVEEALASISRTARLIEANDPGFRNTFQRPKRVSAAAVLTTARLFVRDLEAAASRFRELSLPETVAAELRAALTAYDEAIRQREIGKGASAGARAAIDATLSAAFAAVRQLDVIVVNALREDGVARAEWSRSRKVPYAKRRAEVAGPSEPAPVPVPAEPALATPVPAPQGTPRRPWPAEEAA